MRNSNYKTKFRAWCAEHNLTAADVAQILGISKQAVDSYFQGRRLPSRRTMKLMEERLGIDTRRMFGI